MLEIVFEVFIVLSFGYLAFLSGAMTFMLAIERNAGRTRDEGVSVFLFLLSATIVVLIGGDLLTKFGVIK